MKKTLEERITILECTLDDITPKELAYTAERIIESGALDAYIVPTIMKKARPGYTLTVIARPKDAKRIAEIIFTETPTLGVRFREQKRWALARKTKTIPTPFGKVRIKTARLGDKVKSEPEYEDCAKIALKTKKPLRDILARLRRE